MIERTNDEVSERVSERLWSLLMLVLGRVGTPWVISDSLSGMDLKLYLELVQNGL